MLDKGHVLHDYVTIKFTLDMLVPVTVLSIRTELELSTCVARWGMALGYRSDGHAFELCHRHIHCALLVNQPKYVVSTFVAVCLFM